MTSSSPRVPFLPAPDPGPQLRAALDEACLAVFKLGVQRLFRGPDLRRVLVGSAAHHRYLRAFPRRARRTLQRQRKASLGAIALLLTLGQAPAFGGVLQVARNPPPP